MSRYSIADLENITGIKAHTIRIWEKRYNLITPFRTATNIRYYDNNQMRKLVNVAALIRSGKKISKISKLSAIEIADEVSKLISDKISSGEETYEAFIAHLITHGLEFNENEFNKTLAHAITRFGMLSCYNNIILPLMSRVGFYWSANKLNPAQEHFVSNMLKQKLFSAIDQVPPAASSQQPTLLFLPQDESHEIGLLMAKYILRNAGKQVVYLGANVPFENLKNTVEQTRPEQLLFFLIQLHPFEKMQQYLDLISTEFKAVKIYLAGDNYILSNLTIPKNINVLSNPEDFSQLLSQQ